MSEAEEMPAKWTEVAKISPRGPRNLVVAAHVKRLFLIRDILEQQSTFRWELAERFGVSERRIQGDLTILRSIGVPIRRTRASGYHIEDWYWKQQHRR